MLPAVSAASERAVRAITDRLRAYADRGVFRRFGVRALGRGRLEARFLWHAPEPHRLVIDPARRTLTFVDLLPGVGYPSAMDRALRAFLAGRFAPELPEHRRLDPRRLAVRAINRGGAVSIELRAKRGDLAYATEKLVKLVNEIFFSFLAGPYEEYMVRHFGAPEE